MAARDATGAVMRVSPDKTDAGAFLRLRQACSFLFVPAVRTDRLAKALDSAADMVIADLEDAVAPAQKDAARVTLQAACATLSPEICARLLIRINAADSPWHAQDLQLVAQLARKGLGGVVLPKAEQTSALAVLARAVGPQCALVPLIESVQGLHEAHALATGPQVARLAFGHLDFQVDAGMQCGAGEEELLPVRLAIVLASRRAGIARPIDGITQQTQDTQKLQADTERAVRLGFGAKLCIHPQQIAPVHAVFAPTAQAVAQAHALLQALEAAQGSACMFDGKMVDAPVAQLAREVLLRDAMRATMR